MNVLRNLINHQPDIDKMFFYAKDLYESKYQPKEVYNTKPEVVALKHFKDPKPFMEY